MPIIERIAVEGEQPPASEIIRARQWDADGWPELMFRLIEQYPDWKRCPDCGELTTETGACIVPCGE